jgi:hypothetical protein
MGQIFHATLYRIPTLEYVTVEADKFHANCYSCRGAIRMMHHYLRRGRWNVCYNGNYEELPPDLADGGDEISQEEFALFVSDYELEEDEEYAHIRESVQQQKAKWKDISNNRDWPYEDVEYKGFLVNHTQKQAVDLEKYYGLSISLGFDGEDGHEFEYCADPIPSLTETGGGTDMLLFDGCTTETTEQLIGCWLRDELEIVDKRPRGYRLIKCCFNEIWGAVRYNYYRFGTDADAFVLNRNGNRMGVHALSLSGERGPMAFIKVEDRGEEGIFFKWILADEA